MMLRVSQIAKQVHVSKTKVFGWIHRGDLEAVNVSDTDRPEYRVTEEALAAFLQRRTVVEQVPVRKRRKMLTPVLSSKHHYE